MLQGFVHWYTFQYGAIAHNKASGNKPSTGGTVQRELNT
jgi:hypothetical protein